VEKQMSEFLKKDREIDPYITLEDKIIRGDSCRTRRRPDLVISGIGDLNFLVECDENQHGGKNYSCEEGRMDEIFDEFKSGKIAVIRWNPHGYKKDGVRIKTPIKKRLIMLKDLIKKIARDSHKLKDKHHIMFYYMFYNEDNESICKRWEKTLIYEKGDYEKWLLQK